MVFQMFDALADLGAIAHDIARVAASQGNENVEKAELNNEDVVEEKKDEQDQQQRPATAKPNEDNENETDDHVGTKIWIMGWDIIRVLRERLEVHNEIAEVRWRR